MKFLFVDDENAYESPIAETLAYEAFNGSGHFVRAESRGLNVPEGKKKSNFTIYLLQSVDLPLEDDELDAIQITQEDIDNADVVMTMTHEQKYMLSEVCPAEKLFTVLEYMTGSSDDIISPKGSDLSAYRACYYGFNKAFETLANKWRSEHTEGEM